jgi:hypothetical protein
MLAFKGIKLLLRFKLSVICLGQIFVDSGHFGRFFTWFFLLKII